MLWSWLRGNQWVGRREREGNPGAGLQLRREPVCQLRDVWPRVSAEFERARRYERSVTVAVFSHPGVAERVNGSGHGPNGHGIAGHGAAPDAVALMAGVLAAATREIDLVACHGGCCVVVMPEIGTEDGRKAVRRMRGLCADRLGAPVEAGISVFPGDGWVFLDLVEVARGRAREGEVQGERTEKVGARVEFDTQAAGGTRQQAAGTAG